MGGKEDSYCGWPIRVDRMTLKVTSRTTSRAFLQSITGSGMFMMGRSFTITSTPMVKHRKNAVVTFSARRSVNWLWPASVEHR